MLIAWTCICFCATIVRLCLSSPLPTVDVSRIERVSSFDKRSESGPKIGGANFPDPSIIQVGDTWYAFATRTIGSSIHIQIAQSPDFNTWTIVENANGTQADALPNLPPWVFESSSNTWAPDVNVLSDGTFVMYYCASTTADTSKHCVGAATSDNVTGPYTPVGSEALICNLTAGGAIDPSGWDEDGQRYLLWKVDGNSMGNGGPCGNSVAPFVPTPIMISKVASDGVTLEGSPSTILDNDGASDNGIVEAPSLYQTRDGTYFLFFSPGCFTTTNYKVAYATSPTITGNYTRAPTALFQNGTDGLDSPGGADIYLDGVHMLFHANFGSGRALYTAEVTFGWSTVSA